MTARKRVLIVVNDAGFFLSHRRPIAVGARDAGFETHVAAPRPPGAPSVDIPGVTFHEIPLSRRGMSALSELGSISALVALYRRVRPDLVHHVTAKPILYGGIASRIARVPAVVHAVTGLGYLFISNEPRARVVRQGVRAAYRVATSHPNCAVIFQNEDDRRALGSAIRTKRIVMIPGSGVDLTLFRPTPLPSDGLPIIVLPSRMLWDKGVGELALAAERLRGKARVVLVGGLDPANPAAVPRETLEGWVRSGVVEWWGSRDDMPEVLREATIVCLPSYREGMPKSLLEACAAGRPIVTTDVPGCRDAIAGGDYGALVPLRDAVRLGDTLEALLADRPRLERMAKSAAASADRFSIVRVVDRTIALYRELLSRSANEAS